MKTRNSNFELMRICSMLFIVIGHTFSWGGIIGTVSINSKMIIYLIYGIIAVHVNSFVLLTGYYQSSAKFKSRKIFNLLILMLCYRIVLYTFSVFMGFIPFYGKFNFIYDILPLANLSYWYLNVYFVLYLLSPFLNKFINYIDMKKYIYLLIIIFVFCSIMPRITINEFIDNSGGYSIFHFIFIYLVGAFISKYGSSIQYKIFNQKSIYYLILYLVLVIIKYLINYYGYFLSFNGGLYTTIGNILSYSYDKLIYDDPFVILESIAYFVFFKKLKLISKIINIFAKSTNETYLIHMNRSIRPVLYAFLIGNISKYINNYLLKTFIISFIILLGGCMVYYLRINFIKLCTKIRFIKNINQNINNKFLRLDTFINAI